MRRWLLLLLVFMIGEAFVLAPPELPSTPGMIWRICTFDWEGLPPSIIALFDAIGLLLCLHASFLLTQSRQTKPHPLYALIPSPIFGSFILLPYLALRRHGPVHERPATWLASPILRVGLIAAMVTVLLFGLLIGNLDMFWYELTTRKFSHVMAIDFVVLLALLPPVAMGAL